MAAHCCIQDVPRSWKKELVLETFWQLGMFWFLVFCSFLYKFTFCCLIYQKVFVDMSFSKWLKFICNFILILQIILRKLPETVLNSDFFLMLAHSTLKATQSLAGIRYLRVLEQMSNRLIQSIYCNIMNIFQMPFSCQRGVISNGQ